MTDIVPQGQAPSGALSAEHYQSFEVAKANDSVLGGSDIAQIRSYAAYARAQAQAIHKTIAATNGIDDVAAIKEEATETAQTFAKVGIYADQRIGEILRELPTRQGLRTDITSVDTPTKVQAERNAGIDHHTSIDLQAMAANPDVVQAVLDKAEADGRIPSRKQVLDAIKERDEARKEANMAEWDAAELRRKLTEVRDEVEALQEQSQPEPQVVERTVEVVPDDYDAIKRERDLYLRDLQRMRKSNEDMRRELDKAEDMLGVDKTMQDVRRDVHYLIAATNTYVRQYGGLTWTVQKLSEVDEPTLDELRVAVTNLATFSNALVASLEDFNASR